MTANVELLRNAAQCPVPEPAIVPSSVTATSAVPMGAVQIQQDAACAGATHHHFAVQAAKTEALVQQATPVLAVPVSLAGDVRIQFAVVVVRTEEPVPELIHVRVLLVSLECGAKTQVSSFRVVTCKWELKIVPLVFNAFSSGELQAMSNGMLPMAMQ